jgi:hypothetical protein
MVVGRGGLLHRDVADVHSHKSYDLHANTEALLIGR